MTSTAEERERTRAVPVGAAGMKAAQRVRDCRQAAELTLNDVSTLLTDYGHPIDLSSLARLEKGLRRIDVDDLVALAAVLEVRVTFLLGVSDDHTTGPAQRIAQKVTAEEARRRLEAIAAIVTDGATFELFPDRQSNRTSRDHPASDQGNSLPPQDISNKEDIYVDRARDDDAAAICDLEQGPST
ncbi:helix-turn-helix domain-containing protein [Nocardia sp. alder85J]|uniref:helix-turn-helix domain-containing protein n=1 Tax=Nocardia sp. alder85J TaxID=2862949 RepID=UPI001CD42968|nr:helix-turn-helix transcriptional regulator [Nocardia sp. alder85J]MCX4099131.1 helix-turn-helix transcriptional regulator [Nocardia sp. alder85J]